MLALCGLTLVSFSACQAKAGQIEVSQAYAFATAPGQANGAVFMKIYNDTGKEVHIKGAKTDVSPRAELHTMSMAGDVMQMRQVEAYSIAAGAAYTLEPMHDHIMLMDLKAPLKIGDHFDITLDTSNGDVLVSVEVIAPGTMPEEAHH